MVDPVDFQTAEKSVDLDNDREYLSEWPPVNKRTEESEQFRQAKRPKLDLSNGVEERRRAREGDDRAESERVLWARPALAKWWRKRQKETNTKDYRNMPKSDNPNTLLRFVAW